eukprot:gene19980-22249_t
MRLMAASRFPVRNKQEWAHLSRAGDDDGAGAARDEMQRVGREAGLLTAPTDDPPDEPADPSPGPPGGCLRTPSAQELCTLASGLSLRTPSTLRLSSRGSLQPVQQTDGTTQSPVPAPTESSTSTRWSTTSPIVHIITDPDLGDEADTQRSPTPSTPQSSGDRGDRKGSGSRASSVVSAAPADGVSALLREHGWTCVMLRQVGDPYTRCRRITVVFASICAGASAICPYHAYYKKTAKKL